MRTRLLFLALALGLPLLGSAQTATPGQALAWSHPQAAAESVTRFETNYDNTGYADAGLVAHPTTANQFYQAIPALVTGPHSVVIRACNVAGCSAASAPFNFSMVAGVPTPVAPGSILIITAP